MSVEEDRERLLKAFQNWSEGVEQKLKKRPERKEAFENTSELPINRLYTPLDQTYDTYLSQIGFPGEFPFTRGVQPTMYRGRYWTMRQYAGFAIDFYWTKGNQDYQSPLISPLRLAMIRTTKWPSAK